MVKCVLVSSDRMCLHFCVCICVYLDSIIVAISSIYAGQISQLALGPRSRRFLWGSCRLCGKVNVKVNKIFPSEYILQFYLNTYV